MDSPEPRLVIICPACCRKYAQNVEFVCPYCGYELVSAPYATELPHERVRKPNLYLQGMRALMEFLPYFTSNPRIETDPRIRPQRAIPAEVRHFQKVFYGMGLDVLAFPDVIDGAMRKHPKELLDPFSLDIRGLRAVLTLIFQREKELGAGAIATAVNKGFIAVILKRLQQLLEENGILADYVNDASDA